MLGLSHMALVGKRRSSKHFHILIPRTSACVTLYGKMYFADAIKLRTCIWGDYPDLSGGPNLFIWILRSGELSQAVLRERCEIGRVRKMLWCWLWGRRKGTTSQGMEVTSRSWKRQENGFSSRTQEREAALLSHTLISAKGDLSQIPDVQNCKLTNSCCFKPLLCWYCVTAW